MIIVSGKPMVREAPRTVCSSPGCHIIEANERASAEALAETERIEAIQQRRVADYRRWVPPKYHGRAKLEDLIPELEQWEPKESVFLYGPPGVGKTHQLAAMMLKVAGHYSMQWHSTRQLIIDIQATYGSKHAKMPAIANDPTGPQVLVLSDLTATRATPNVAQIIGSIIDARYHANLPVIIDDNRHVEDWVARAGDDDDLALELERMASRVVEMTAFPLGRFVLHPGTEDRRLNGGA